MVNKLIDYLKLIRLPGWGAFSVTAIFGAITVGVLDPLSLIILFIIGGCVTLYGFVLNDYIDVATDTLSKDLMQRPLVKGTISKKHALYISLGGLVFSYVIIILAMLNDVFLYNMNIILVFTTAVILAAFYNIYGKTLLGSDLFVAGATALFCLFGAITVSHQLTSLTWVVTIVTFFQVFYLNAIIGGLKDADHDYKMGGTNIALRLGIKIIDEQLIVPWSFKTLALLIRTCSLITIFIPFIFIDQFLFEIWQPIVITGLFFGVYYTTIKMLTMNKFLRSDLRKLISIQAFLRYSVVPVMLLSITGYPFGIFLIVFPFFWYILFNQLFYGSFLRPQIL